METKTIVIIVIIIAVFIALYYYMRKDKKEGFAGIGNIFKVKVDAEQRSGIGKDAFYSVPATYQALLSPRFSALNDYGSFIRYNMPEEDYTGVPRNPLTYGNMVKEEYQPNDAPYFGGNQSNITDYTAPGYKEQEAKLQYAQTEDLLPLSDMSQLTASGEMVQPIVYERFMYANQRSRLYGQGDPIRGDLPIVPCQADWFRPSVHPQIDLRDGAMMAMSGINNNTSQQVYALMNAASRNTTKAFAGVAPSFATEKQLGLAAAGGDIQVTAFP